MLFFFAIKNISLYSFMAAQGNDLHQDFSIIFHFVQVYKRL